ncbi:rubredoxin [uncultured Desulfuromusa sp.]|uniref:rubredoxin n=1 Tax=uncultured Desulfuromusa sp. TaxID=219183 RepID=UPI002AA62CEA|nr:rubredoxin [uncultured Desulfuromusa sp.]
MRYICTCCGYIYDPEKGDQMNKVSPGVEFEDLPESWVCPLCYAERDKFDPLD